MVADRYRVVSLLGRGGMGEVYGADHLKLGQRIALKFLPTDRRMAVHSLRHSLAHAMLDAGAPLPVVQRALRHRSIGSTGVYVEADGRDVDKWRARAITGAAPAEPLSLAAIQAEMERLAALALSMQGAQDTPEPAPGATSGEM